MGFNYNWTSDEHKRMTDNDIVRLGCSNISETIDDYALYATNSLYINDRAQIISPNTRTAVANLSGTGEFIIGKSARTTEIISNSNVTLRNDAIVEGDLITANTLTTQLGADVIGEIYENKGDIGHLGLTNNNNRISNSTTDVSLELSESETLSPGNYGNIHLKSGSSLTLSTSGIYNFTSIIMEPNSTINLPHSYLAYEYIINVANNVCIKRDCEINGTSSNILWNIAGSSIYISSCDFKGTILAPDAKINIDGGKNTSFYGAIFGNEITIHQDTKINWKPLDLDDMIDLTSEHYSTAVSDGFILLQGQNPVPSSTNSFTFTIDNLYEELLLKRIRIEYRLIDASSSTLEISRRITEIGNNTFSVDIGNYTGIISVRIFVESGSFWEDDVYLGRLTYTIN